MVQQSVCFSRAAGVYRRAPFSGTTRSHKSGRDAAIPGKHHVLALLGGERKSVQPSDFVGILAAVPGERTARDGPASSRVVVQHAVQRRYAAIVHIGSAKRDVAERRRIKFADVLGIAGELVES